MSWVTKLFHRGDDHAKWLAEHPGKDSSTKAPPPAVSASDEAHVRQKMEQELDDQRARRQ